MSTPPDNSALYRSVEGYQEAMAFYDATLSTLAVPYETHHVDTSPGPSFVVTCGRQEGKPVVLWHGQNANLITWIRWIPALATDYRVYAVDVIGGMGRSAPSRPSKKGPAYGQWAAEVLQELGLERSSMIGASQGGWLIVKLANVAPEMIGTAVLMSSAGFMPVSLTRTLRTLPRILFKPPAVAARAMLSLMSAPDVPPDPVFQDLFELMIKHFRSESLVPSLSDEELRALQAPCYLLMGQHEAAVDPYKVLARGLRLLPHLVIAEIVPGVGHSMVHRHPEWVTSRVMRFLEEHAT